MLQERLCFAAQRLQLVACLRELFQGETLFEMKLGPLVGVGLALDGELIDLLLMPVVEPGDLRVFLLQHRSGFRKFALPGFDPLLHFLFALFKLLPGRIDLGELQLVRFQAIGDFLVPGVDLLGAACNCSCRAAQPILALQDGDAALLKRLAFAFDMFLRLGNLRQPALQDPLGLHELAAQLVELAGLAPQTLVFQDEIVLRLLELAHGCVHHGAAFKPFLAVAFILALVAFDVAPELFDFFVLARQLGIAGVLARAAVRQVAVRACGYRRASFRAGCARP